MISGLDLKRVDAIIRFSLKEDIWKGDITSSSVLDEDTLIDSVILARQRGVLCGIDIVERIFARVDPELKFRPQAVDGDALDDGMETAFIEGRAASVLKAERTALNYLSILSGVATKTRAMVDKVSGTGVKIYDTRKTLPLHRYFQKYAVTVGGGENHRKGLWDMVLIKDNHIRAFSSSTGEKSSGTIIPHLIRRARASVQKNIRVEIEVENLVECGYALSEKPDVIMLDNMSPKTVRKAVDLRKKMRLDGEVLFEVSGGINLENVRDYAETGIEIISSGSLTGSVDPVDFSLEVILKNGEISAS
ncbi:MAG: carboxylating nicotinate-nucleotide diphosphorylase [Candidatus Omnitrophica bacterium]|nr:carboxylating nicotinate-nucleotide diphosphorylase [Candidatus Omnitrophota bacterium]